MGNHYHLQLETLETNLSAAMQWLNLTYGGWFNRRYRRVGPLFQGRFKATLHDSSPAALTINRYIHLNPVRVKGLGGHEVRAGAPERLKVDAENLEPDLMLLKARVEVLRTYRWSSYPVYVGSAKNPGWLTTTEIYRFFGDHTLHSLRGAYRRQLEEMAALGRWESGWKEEVKAAMLFGTESFVEKMGSLLKGDRREQTPVRLARRLHLTWADIVQGVESAWGGQWDQVSTERGNGALPAALYLGQRHAGLRLAELGQFCGGMEYSAVNAAISRFEKRLKVDSGLRTKLRKAAEILKIEI